MQRRRALIARRGHSATGEDIRAFRQVLIQARDDPRRAAILKTVDLHSVSGCRDMLVNVTEHRFTIPRIAAFLSGEALSFLGFELDPGVIAKFQAEYPGDDALLALERWRRFEQDHPQTFGDMYQFSIRRR